MALSRPLVIAVAAFALLVGSVTFELTFHRTFAVDVHDAGGWQTIAEFGQRSESYARPIAQDHAVAVNASENVTFRVRVENGYPWAYDHSWRATAGGLIVGEGTLHAPSRDAGTSEFNVRASTLLSRSDGPVKPGGGDGTTFAYLDVTIGNVDVSGQVTLQEVSR